MFNRLSSIEHVAKEPLLCTEFKRRWSHIASLICVPEHTPGVSNSKQWLHQPQRQADRALGATVSDCCEIPPVSFSGDERGRGVERLVSAVVVSGGLLKLNTWEDVSGAFAVITLSTVGFNLTPKPGDVE